MRARRIQELAQQGHTDEAIAQQLGRSTNAIRNIRHRTNIKTRETQTIQQLKETKQTLEQQTKLIQQELGKLKVKRDQIHQALQVEETKFIKKIETERSGRRQRIETLINEEALLLAKYIRKENDKWIPRIA